MKITVSRLTLFFSVGFILLNLIVIKAQDTKIFRSDVETEKKPWTSLQFDNNPDNFQFAIVSDRTEGARRGVFEDAIAKLNKMHPEFVLSIGDFIQGYTRDTVLINKQWIEFNSKLDKLNAPFFRLPGNHDITNTVMQKDWEKRYGKRYYYFIYKNTLFIILDSNIGSKEPMIEFALKTLKDNPDVRWTFVLMHHPEWLSYPDGWFKQIESALSDRNYTVFAGHIHRYYSLEKDRKNYYVLATTGGSSRLRGNYFGEFDHIGWLTMTDDGPSFVNIRLDGILPDDVSNSITAPLARVLTNNSGFENMLLCNDGEKFSNGTLYIKLTNPSTKALHLDARFFHNHQLKISKPEINITLEPESDKIIEIQLEAYYPLPYSELETLQMDWELYYELQEYPGFKLDGTHTFTVTPSETSSLEPTLSRFLDKIVVMAKPEDFNLIPRYTTDGSAPTTASDIFNKSLILNQTETISLRYFNKDGEGSRPEVKSYEKIEIEKGVKIKELKDGLRYSYYEGSWQKLPDFSGIEPLKTGIASDFSFLTEDSLRKDHFGIVMKGYFYAPENGMYLFKTRTNDASRILINSSLITNEDLPKSPSSFFGNIALKKGYHPVEIQFFERQGEQSIRIYYKLADEINMQILEDEESNKWNLLEMEGSFYYK